jgi:hypothetical protein
MDGNIFNSQGVRVAAVIGSSIFSPTGKKLYDPGHQNIQAVWRASWASRERERTASGPSDGQAVSRLLICLKIHPPSGHFRPRRQTEALL